MTRYKSTSAGFLNLDTGEVEPFTHRAYDASNPPPLPMVMRGDDQEPLRSMADGKIYTSKAAMRESYRAANNPEGKEFVEVGNEMDYVNPVHKPLEVRKEDVAEAVIKAEAAVARGEFDHVV